VIDAIWGPNTEGTTDQNGEGAIGVGASKPVKGVMIGEEKRAELGKITEEVGTCSA